MTELIVTNFNRNFTGVSATAAGVLRAQAPRYDLALAGRALPGCPAPVSAAEARRLTRTPPEGRDFAIWHVRRNTEMRAALWARDAGYAQMDDAGAAREVADGPRLGEVVTHLMAAPEDLAIMQNRAAAFAAAQEDSLADLGSTLCVALGLR